MKTLSFLGVLAAVAVAFVPFQTAEAGHRHGCGCCGTAVYAAPVAASPATAAAPASQNAVAQNQGQGYRSFSYQPGAAAPAMNFSSGNNYYRSSNRRSNQPMWMNGGNKSLGRYN